MSIQKIRLQRFRGFLDAAIDLKPLTVLLGPNSAGKSAFGHALAAMAHAHSVSAGTAQASLTPAAQDAHTWPIDLGSSGDLRTHGSSGPIVAGLLTSVGWVHLGFGLSSPASPLILSYLSHPYNQASSAAGIPTVQKAETGTPVHSDVVSVPLDRIHAVEPLEVSRNAEDHWIEKSAPVSVILDGLILKEVQNPTRTPGGLSDVAREELRAFFRNLTYLRATRQRPLRGYPPRVTRRHDVGYTGEHVPEILARRGAESVTFQDPPGIPESVDEARRGNYDWRGRTDTLVNAVGAWLAKMGLASAIEAATTGERAPIMLGITLPDQARHDITEIGFGVSQVLPVLVAGLLQSPHGVLIVDLPEAHLHPRPQGVLADFFCALALSGRQALVETHSEMFFHRLRLRAAMEPKLLDKICVYFIDQPSAGHCSPPREVGLRMEDEVQWPAGFLQEAWETESQIRAVRQGLLNPDK